MSRLYRIALFCLPLLFAAGCQSYVIVQENLFSDERGNVVRVEYGRSESYHVNTFKNPKTGETLDFKSKLVVRVHLPDDDSFKAWQCMNFLGTGTMYKTDNEKWMFLANGFTCFVYRRDDENETRYREIYRGALCESPKSDYRPSDKWRDLKKDARGNWR